MEKNNYKKKSEKKKISVIIPVYNAGKYISRCLDSIINQDLPDIEIICVDDGSTDESWEILEKYDSMYEEVRILHQKNRFAGVARNTGLELASGEYIHFMDVDDYLFPNVYKNIYNFAKERQLDYVKIRSKCFSAISGLEVEDQSSNYSVSYLREEDFGKLISIKNQPNELIDCSFRAPWGGLYKKEFLDRNHIRFNNLKCVNDRSFYVQVICSAQRIAYANIYAVWHQIENAQSLMGIRKDNFICHFNSYYMIERYMNNEDLSLRRRILTAELNDLLFWFTQLSDAQKEKIKWELFQFILTLDWSKLNRSQVIFDSVKEINSLLSEYGYAKKIPLEQLVKICDKYELLYLYGAGVMGKRVLHYLQSYGIKPECIIVSDCADANYIEGIEVKKISDIVFPDQNMVVMLSALNNYHIQMIHELKKKGVKHIIALSNEDMEKINMELEGDVYIIADGTSEDIIRKRTPRKDLKIVIDIAEHCNLNCQNCDHFSPLSKEYFMSFDQFKKDIAHLSDIMKNQISMLKIEGGEPLLNPSIEKYIHCARYYLDNAQIVIVTNGILLPKQSETFWRACKECEVIISATKYPIDFDYTKVEEICAQYGVTFNYFNSGQPIKTSKYKPIDLNGEQDKYVSFHNCYMANGECADLKNGKLYPCTFAANIHIFNEHFDKSLEISSKDYIDIYGDIQPQDVLDFMCNPRPACRYCKSTEWKEGFTWKTSTKNIEEWT